MKSTIETIKSELIAELIAELSAEIIEEPEHSLSPVSLAKENVERGVYKLTKGEEQQLEALS